MLNLFFFQLGHGNFNYKGRVSIFLNHVNLRANWIQVSSCSVLGCSSRNIHRGFDVLCFCVYKIIMKTVVFLPEIFSSPSLTRANLVPKPAAMSEADYRTSDFRRAKTKKRRIR